MQFKLLCKESEENKYHIHRDFKSTSQCFNKYSLPWLSLKCAKPSFSRQWPESTKHVWDSFNWRVLRRISKVTSVLIVYHSKCVHQHCVNFISKLLWDGNYPSDCLKHCWDKPHIKKKKLSHEPMPKCYIKWMYTWWCE